METEIYDFSLVSFFHHCLFLSQPVKCMYLRLYMSFLICIHNLSIYLSIYLLQPVLINLKFFLSFNKSSSTQDIYMHASVYMTYSKLKSHQRRQNRREGVSPQSSGRSGDGNHLWSRNNPSLCLCLCLSFSFAFSLSLFVSLYIYITRHFLKIPRR